MKIWAIDFDEVRLSSIVSAVGREVKSTQFLPEDPVEYAQFDLILLHVGSDQNEDGDLDRSMEIFANKPVLCYSGGEPDFPVRTITKSQESLWCLCPEQIGRSITAEQFINSHAGKVICRYIQRIGEGGNPTDAKNELQGFSVELEEKLEKLYGMLQSGKQTEEVIEERNKLDALLTELAL